MPDGLSFAFMNLSKFSNERASWQMIPGLMTCSVNASHGARNFIQEQVEILCPHVVVSMNLDERLDLLGPREEIDRVPHIAEVYRLKIGAKSALLINTFHFSAPGKNDRAFYLDPIRNLAAKHLTNLES